MTHSKSLLFLMIALAIVLALAIRIYVAQDAALSSANDAFSKGEAVLIDEKASPESISSLLISHGYIKDEDEADFIARHLVERILGDAGRPTSIKDLGKERFGIDLDSAGFSRIANFPYLQERAELIAGGTLIEHGAARPVSDPELSKKYSVHIRDKEGGSHRDTIYLCIKEHFNELVESDGKIIDCHSRDSLYAWFPVCGDADIWLPVKNTQGTGRYFSVVPVERGYNFGSARGTYGNARRSFKFIRRRAILPLFGKATLKKMREDNSIYVRSVQEYRDRFISTFALFGALWIFVFLILAIIDKRRGGYSALGLLSLAALMSGFGLVNLFNLQNPLWGELFAWSQLLKGVALGMVLLVIGAFVDWTGLFRYSHRVHLSSGRRGMQGVWLAITAIIIAAVLLFFGYGPGGTHVTLPVVPIQGSPLIKLLLIGYLAVIFACRNDLIEAYSRPGKFWRQMTVLLMALLTLFVLGIIQLMISDLGPFLVIAITAIFLFSLATNETISMLVGGALFGLAIAISGKFVNYSFLPFAIFIIFAAGWSLYSYSRYERVKLSPIALSMVLLLAFYGGTLFSMIGKDDIADRLNGRAAIAASTFDNEVIGGSQVAEGIWAVSRGGFWGMPETGLAATLPAGHTDLALESLVENLGLLSGIMILVCLGIILFIALRTGIRNGHPFGFAFASLLALSLGVQAVLIVLGSLGIIPLTGVTLPFISYGGTALAIDLACIGILISLSRNKDYELECINTQKYESMSKGQLWAYIVLAAIATFSILDYGWISRKQYLVKPGKFINNSGERIALINPLIDATQKRLVPGDILDRRGAVLATINKDGTRNYPYENYTFMSVGDLNTKILWGSTGKRPAGILAEERYESLIRGFNTNPVNFTLRSCRHYSRFLPDVALSKEESVRIEDYSALLPMMLSQKEVREWNERKMERNIQLTIDAELQTALSKRAELFVHSMKRLGKTTDRTRVSIVAIDASDGALLTSAMYPLPSKNKLRELALSGTTIYRDFTPGFKAYTDLDLGLVPLQPGSTIKLLTAGAGLNRFSTALAGDTFNQAVNSDEIVDISLGEPFGDVSLKQAIVLSSNVYFIKLLNQYGENGLYPELAHLYYAVGARFGNSTPYVLYPEQRITGEHSYQKQVESFGRKSVEKFADYLESGKHHRLIDSEYQPAWGQGVVSMTPLSLCRYVAAVANNGVMMHPRYESSDSVYAYRTLMKPEEAAALQDCMRGQAAGRFGEISAHIGGKTGTPTREDRSKRSGKCNDALYCFFVDAEGTTSGRPIAVVVRLERVNDYSRLALKMTDEVVIPVLREKGYII